jgi:hypothetical protein
VGFNHPQPRPVRSFSLRFFMDLQVERHIAGAVISRAEKRAAKRLLSRAA